MTTRPKQADAKPPALLPLSIIRTLWKRKLSIVVVSALLCTASTMVVRKLPSVYNAEVLVLIDSQKIPEKFVSSTVTTGVDDRLAAISQEIMSTTRLLKIIQDLGLYKDERVSKTQEQIVEQMRSDITVTVQKDKWATGRPVAFKVGYQGRNPILVAEVANRLANLYIEENRQTLELEASGTSTFIDNQLADAKRQLAEQEAKVAQFKRDHNGSLPEQESSLLSAIGNLRVQLQGVQDSLNRSQQNKLMLEAELATDQSSDKNLERALQLRLSGAAVPSGDFGDSEDRTLPMLQHRLEELESEYTPDYPDIIALKAQIVQMQKDVAQQQLPSPSAGQSKEPLRSRHAAMPVSRDVLQARGKVAMLKAQLAAVQHDIDFDKTERQRLLQQIGQSEAKVDQLPIVEQEMAGLTRDYETYKANYKSLLEKQIAAQMASDMELRQKSEHFKIIDPARVPEKPFKPKKMVWFGVGSILSVGIGLLAGFGLELRNAVLLGEWELPQNVAILGRVPVIDMNPKGSGKHTRILKSVMVGSAAICVAAAGAAYHFLRATF